MNGLAPQPRDLQVTHRTDPLRSWQLAFTLPPTPYWQPPLTQVPPVPQGVPSGKGLELHKPLEGLQESLVQAWPSSQLLAVPWQVPAVQASPNVHRLLSSHAVPSCAVL